MKKLLGYKVNTLIQNDGKRQKLENSYFKSPINDIPNEEVIEINVDHIFSLENPRTSFNPIDIKELAESIKSYGLLQPITVRRIENKYYLIAGERRWRAFKFLKRLKIPAIVKNVDSIDPENLTEIKLVENIQREDLSDFEIASSLITLKSKKKLTNELLARKINKTESWVKAKIAHISSLEAIFKEGSSTNLDSLKNIPSSVWVELASSIKESPEEVSSWLNLLISNGQIPKQNEARSFALSLKKPSLKNKITKNPSLDSLNSELGTITEKIKKLQKRKKYLENYIKEISAHK